MKRSRSGFVGDFRIRTGVEQCSGGKIAFKGGSNQKGCHAVAQSIVRIRTGFQKALNRYSRRLSKPRRGVR